MFRIEYEFEINTLICGDTSDVCQRSGVLSNRWSCQDVIDQNFTMTRTYRGRMRVA